MTKIAVISDDNTVLNATADKLVLLRKNDSIVKCGINEFELVKMYSQICVLHIKHVDEDAIKLIEQLKSNDKIIILMCDEFEQQSLLRAYDAGINDFCRTTVSNYELLIKIINAQRLLDKNILIKELTEKLLSKGVLNSNNGMYKNFVDAVEGMNGGKSALAISVKDCERFLTRNGDELLLKNVRCGDKFVNYENFKYLLLLANTETNNVSKVFDRLKNIINVPMSGVILNTENKSQTEILNTVKKLETELIGSDRQLITEVFSESDVEEDWLDTELTLDEPKNYKFFKTIFDKKTEKIIIPVLYRATQKYENNSENIKIKYYSDKISSELIIFNFDKKSSFKIMYQNSPKVKIVETSYGLSNPEPKEYELTFAQLSIRELTSLVDSFILKNLKE